MEPRISLITLGVADLERATRFYEECLGLPRLRTPPSITFFELGKTWLALWSRESLAADAGLSPEGSGFPAGRAHLNSGPGRRAGNGHPSKLGGCAL